MTVRPIGRPGTRLGALILVAVLAAALVLGGALSAWASPPPARSISGHVTDTDGHGVEGVVVSAWTAAVVNDGTSSTWSNRATTDADGAYKIPDLAPAKYDVSVDLTAKPFLKWTDPQRVDVIGADAVANFVTTRAGAVSGRTVDTHGAPVANAPVALGKAAPWGWTYEAWTDSDANGNYTLPKITPGDYWVQFEQDFDPAYVLQSPLGRTDVTVAAGTVSAGPTGVFQAAGHISATLLDGNNGLPVSYVALYLTRIGDGAQTWTYSGSDGSFDAAVAPGSYTITPQDIFSIYNHVTPVGTINVMAGQRVALGPLAITSSRTDVYYVSGRVRDAQTGRAIDGAEVNLWRDGGDGINRDIYADTQGRYSILVSGTTADVPSPHEYQIWYFSAKLDSQGDPVPAYVTQNTAVTVDTADITRNVALDEGGRIMGRVTDGHGKPLAGVPVAAYRPQSVSGYPGGTSGYPGGTSGYPGGTSGYPGGTSGYAASYGQTDRNGNYVIGALQSSSGYRVDFNMPSDGSAPAPISGLGFAYHNHPYFHSPVTASGYGSATSVSGYDSVVVDYNSRTKGINQAIPVPGDVKFLADSADHPLGGIGIQLDYLYRGYWVHVEHGFTEAGQLDSGAIPPGRYRVSWRDYFGRLDGTGDVREFHIAAGQTKTIRLISATAGGSVPLGGGKVTGSFLGAAGSLGVFSARSLSVVPNPGGLPVGTRRIAAYDVAFSGPYQGEWTLTLPYGPTVSTASAVQMVVSHYLAADGTWQQITPVAVDTFHRTITFKTPTLSPFVLSVPQPLQARFSAPTASDKKPYVGDSVSIGTVLTNSLDGTALTGRTDVVLQSSADGSTWSSAVASVTAGANGAYSATVVPAHDGAISYRFTVPSYPPNFTGASSAAVKIIAKLGETSWSAAVLATGAAQAIVPFGGSAVASATLRDHNGAPLVTAAAVVVQSSTNGTTFVATSIAATKVAPGVYNAVLTPAVKTYYRFAFAGDAANAAATPSSAVFVAPQFALSEPSAPATATAGQTFTVSGTLSPSASANAKTVKIYYERKNGSAWTAVDNVWAVNTPKGTYSTYSAAFKLAAGTYRFRASAPEDAAHAATGYTGYVTVVVK